MIEYQLFAQKQKPDRFVVVAAYGDLATGYICTEQAFFQGGYEPGASHVAPKSEGILKEAICKLLESELGRSCRLSKKQCTSFLHAGGSR